MSDDHGAADVRREVERLAARHPEIFGTSETPSPTDPNPLVVAVVAGQSHYFPERND